MSADRAESAQADAAVVDVGSNSVRLVLYRLDGRAIWSIFNEKILAGLGRDLAVTGRLAPKGVQTALIALSRFQALIEGANPPLIHVVATAAVRDAKDGEAFRRRVAAETGLELRILSGAEEARTSALGAMAGAPGLDGLVGDLGGASMELVRIENGQPGLGVTLPLGPFSLAGEFDPGRVRATAERLLNPLRSEFASRRLTCVGGAWRNLALLHMQLTGYPLAIVHQYEMSREEALDTARFVERQSRASLERIEVISRRRIESLPHAAAVLASLVESFKFERVAFSAYGLREGLIYDAMSSARKADSPLTAGCAALGGRPAAAEELGAALEAWLAKAFGKLEPRFGARDRALLAAACRLADLGTQLHPDHRASLIFEQVLRAPIAGLGHDERVFLACAAFARHTASRDKPDAPIVSRLLSPERYQRARALGAAIRLGCDLSGRSPELLGRTRLDIRPKDLTLQADPGWEEICLGEAVAKRAQTLAGLLNRPLRLKGGLEPARKAG